MPLVTFPYEHSHQWRSRSGHSQGQAARREDREQAAQAQKSVRIDQDHARHGEGLLGGILSRDPLLGHQRRLAGLALNLAHVIPDVLVGIGYLSTPPSSPSV